MSNLREAAQQALDEIECDLLYLFGRASLEGHESGQRLAMAVREKMKAARAALAKPDDPTDPGHDVNVLREHVRHLERQVRQLHAENLAHPDDKAQLVACAGWKLVPVERSYDERVNQIIAFNKCNGDLDDKLDAAHRAIPSVEQPPAEHGAEDEMIRAVDAAMVEMRNIYPPLRRSECKRLIAAAFEAVRGGAV